MKIKNCIYLLLMLLVTLLPTGCTDKYEMLTTSSDSDKVDWNISVTLPGANAQSTRAFGNPSFAFTDLYAAVFVEIDGIYYFSELVRAGNSNPTWDEVGQCWKFGLTLNKTTARTRLHLIANYPNLTMGNGEEGMLIGSLETDDVNHEGGHDVYWNCVNLPSGIDDGFETQVQMVPLVRNYAQIKLEKSKDITDFKITRYALYNAPKRGRVAPYNPQRKQGAPVFANYINETTIEGKDYYVMKYVTGDNVGTTVNKPKDDYLKKVDVTNGDETEEYYVMKEDNGAIYTYTCQSYDNLLSVQGYEGNEAYDGNGQLLETTPNWIAVSDENNIPATYIYERSNRQATNPTSIIVEGKYDTDKDKNFDEEEVSYYKLDFIYDNTDAGTKVRYNLLRNFIYTMNITNVSGPGYETPTEAINKPASNNIGGDALAKDYTNISNGASQLFVSTTYVLFTNNKQVDVYYKYIPNIENITTTDNGAVNMDAKAGNVLKVDAIRANSDETSGMYTGWRKVTLTPKDPSTEAQYQEITFAAGDLQRTIELLLRTPYNLSVEVTPEVLKKTKTPVDIYITLPAQGIPTSVFPLRMFISSKHNTIYPQYGTNIPADAQGGKYGFIREISLDEYNKSEVINEGNATYKVFASEFITNCAESATEVYVDNEYFNRGIDDFINFERKSITVNTSVPVTVELVNGKYPEEIYNDGANDGKEESVDVTLNGTSVGKIIINKDNVANDATLTNTVDFADDDVLTFTFKDYSVKENNSRDKNITYVATCTVQQLLSGTYTLEFKRQYRRTIEIHAEQPVEVKREEIKTTGQWGNTTTTNVYPYKIYNNRTEEVTVKLNGKEVGKIKIDKDKVTENAVLTYNGDELEFSDDDILTFTFEDQYATGYSYYGRYTWSDEVIYTATCTVEQLLNGTRLNFTHPY